MFMIFMKDSLVATTSGAKVSRTLSESQIPPLSKCVQQSTPRNQTNLFFNIREAQNEKKIFMSRSSLCDNVLSRLDMGRFFIVP